MSRNKTPSEKKLWAELKDKRLGVSFHSQKVMYGYIVDFWCPSAGLVVEVDGKSHLRSGQIKWDKKRDAVMRSKGISVLRFTNSEVKQNLPTVVGLIRRRIKQRLA